MDGKAVFVLREVTVGYLALTGLLGVFHLIESRREKAHELKASGRVGTQEYGMSREGDIRTT